MKDCAYHLSRYHYPVNGIQYITNTIRYSISRVKTKPSYIHNENNAHIVPLVDVDGSFVDQKVQFYNYIIFPTPTIRKYVNNASRIHKTLPVSSHTWPR